jgi:succinoglycan biosynthesis transport protein ExoP
MGAAQNYASISRRQPDVEDYIDMLRRYRSWIIGPMYAGLVISVVIAFIWPDTYVSSALMRITPQQVSEHLVPSELTQQMSDRLTQMEQQILSRTDLIELITRPSLNLYPKDRAQRSIEDIVQDMRTKDIKIAMYDSPGATSDRRFASAFQIAFRYNDRFKAQAVVRELVSKFTEQNENAQADSIRLTTNFMDDELKRAKEHLDEMQARMTRFEMENNGRLPAQFEGNVQAANMSSMEASRIAEQLNAAQTQKLMLENQLNNYINDQKYVQSNSERTVNAPNIAVKNQQLINVESQLQGAKSQLASMQKMYGENYPDVNQLKASISSLEGQKAELEKSQTEQNSAAQTGPMKIQDPQAQAQLENLRDNISSVRVRIQAGQVELERLTQAQAEMNKRVGAFQARIDQAPLNQQQYVQLDHDLGLAKSDYDDKSKRRDLAQTSQNLTAHKAGESLELLDPANLPDTPVEPNRPLFAASGTAIGLMLGLVLAAVKEMKDASLKNLKDVRAYTNLAVLSSIPLLENALLVRRKRRLFWLAWSCAFVVGSIAVSGAMYYRFFGRS